MSAAVDRTLDQAKMLIRPPEGAAADEGVLRFALVLSVIGLSLLVFVAYAFVFTGLQEARVQRGLLEQFDSTNKHLQNQLLTGLNLRDGQPAALLQIPRIGLHQVVVKGTSSTDLMSGPGLMANTALPGTRGNSVIAGRRSTAGAPFGHILSLRAGDRITVVTGLGKFRYRVVSVGTAIPGNADPISPTRTARLTLVTANPPLVADGRAYVIATLLTKPATAPLPDHSPSQSQRGLAGDPSAIFQAVLWGFVFIGAIVVVVGAYRRWNKQVWAIYLVSTPIVLTTSLLCFENLYRLLPATL